jgi:hypothetical protein
MGEPCPGFVEFTTQNHKVPGFIHGFCKFFHKIDRGGTSLCIIPHLKARITQAYVVILPMAVEKTRMLGYIEVNKPKQRSGCS